MPIGRPTVSEWQPALVAGWLGSSLTVVAFFMRVPIRLRQITIGANVLLAIFTGHYHLYASLAANLTLIPLNVWRLRELYATRRAVRAAMATTDLSWDWLRPFMTRRRFAAGTTIFEKGAPADELFFILDGTVRLHEVGVDLTIGALFGEIAMFSPQRERMSTATATTDTTVLTIGEEPLAELYEKNPQFAVYIVRLITQRLLDDLEGHRNALGGPLPAPPATSARQSDPTASDGVHSGAIAP